MLPAARLNFPKCGAYAQRAAGAARSDSVQAVEAGGSMTDATAYDPTRNRDTFLLTLRRELYGTLEGVVGMAEAEGLISVVGRRVAAAIDAEARRANNGEAMSVDQVARVLVQLKQRIEGGFSIESIDEDRIILVNTRCPFGSYVVGRSSLCMMTSNVFGYVSAQNLGYAKVELDKTIARGDDGCRIVVYLSADAAPGSHGREYFRDADA
jgi:predicted ArsR family transcriptional regulator